MDTTILLGGNWTDVGYGYFNAELGMYMPDLGRWGVILPLRDE